MLKGDRVVLSHLTPADREIMFAWMNDAETVRFNAPYSPLSWDAHCRWFDTIGSHPDRRVFAIRLDNTLIGTVSLVDIHPVHRTAELTTRIGAAEHRGHGLGVEAVSLAIQFAFRDMNLQRVWLRVFANNARAIRAYEKAGFTQEGTMRRAAFINGAWTDEHVMAVLRPSVD